MCNLPEAYVKQIFEENKKLKERVATLENRLSLFESPHIPSSKHIIKEVREPKEPAKRGAPEGHRGATRETAKPNRIVVLKPKICPRCRNKKVRIGKQHTKTGEDVVITKIVTRFYFYDCFCENCGNEFTTSDGELPKDGRFGPNISSIWTMLHYQGVIPFERLSKISENCFGIPVTPAGLHNVIYHNTHILQPYFDGIAKRVARAKYVRSDETSYPFNGENYWMWNVSTRKDTLVLLRDNRSARVLNEIFGDVFDGVLNSDCFRAYDRFKAKEYQKCWAHILRDAKDLAKNSREGLKLYRMLSRMYMYIQSIKEGKQENTAKVKAWVWRAKRAINSWLDRNYQSKAVLNLVLRLAKHRDSWFTCLKYPYVEPTNNASERDIRKGVIARKVSGQHRSMLGMHSREIMMSTILTCMKRNLNPFRFVRENIGKYNLGLKVS